jgi:O-antigen/teichoic acid export membrane protein
MRPQSLTFKTLLLASGKILAAFSAVGITAILTRVLSVEDYATHKQALLIYAMCAPALMLGLPKALYFFLPGETERPRAYLLNNIILLFGLGSFFCVAVSLGAGEFFARHFENERLTELAPLIGVYGLAMLPMAAFSACMMSTDRVATLVRFQVLAQLALVCTIAVAAYAFGTPQATLTGYAGWAIIAMLISVALMLGATRGGTDSRPSWTGMKTQLGYGIPLGLAAMFGSLSSQIDKFMVSVMCSQTEFAIYVTGALEIPLIGVITGAMNAVVLPELAKFYKAGQLDAIVGLWQRAMNKAILVLAPAMFGVLLLAPELMVTLFSSTYEAASEPFRIYALALPARAAVFASVLMATDRTRWVTIAAVIGLSANAGLNLLFVTWFGAKGAAWASVLTTYLVVAFMFVPMCKALECHLARLVAWSHLGRVLLAAGIPGGALFLIRPYIELAPFVTLLVFGTAYCLLVVLMYRIAGVATITEIIDFLKKRQR